MAHITVAQIKVLDAIAREKSFSRAAAYLGVSQPAVSLQLRELQKRYQVGMYYRRGRKIYLSGLGLDLVKTGRKVLGLLDEMDVSLQEATELLSGRIHIGLSCHYFVKGLIVRFMENYPGVKVKATIGHSGRLMAEVLECRMDVAEITAVEPNPALYNLEFSRQEIFVFVAAGHRWGDRNSMDIRELHQQKMVALHMSSMTRQIFASHLERREVCPDIVLELDNWDTMKEAVVDGIGFGVALEDEFGPDPRLKKIRIDKADLTACQYIVCQPEYRELKVISAFFDIVKKEKEKHYLLKQRTKGEQQ